MNLGSYLSTYGGADVGHFVRDGGGHDVVDGLGVGGELKGDAVDDFDDLGGEIDGPLQLLDAHGRVDGFIGADVGGHGQEEEGEELLHDVEDESGGAEKVEVVCRVG